MNDTISLIIINRAVINKNSVSNKIAEIEPEWIAVSFSDNILMSDKAITLRQQLNLEATSYKFDRTLMKRCRPSAPKLYRSANGHMVGVDLWIDWNGRLFYIRRTDDNNNTIITYLNE